MGNAFPIRSHIDVAMAWVAHNRGDYRKSSREKCNMNYRGPLLYSRVTPVARIWNPGTNKMFALVTSARYSVSTQTHLRRAWRALSDKGLPVAHVPNIGAPGGHSSWSDEQPMSDADLHAANRAYLNEELAKMVAVSIKRWRLTWWNDNTVNNFVSHAWRAATDYCLMVGIESTLGPLEFYIDQALAGRKAKSDLYHAPARVRARERAYALRVAKQAFGIAA